MALSADSVHLRRPWHFCITVSVAYDTRQAVKGMRENYDEIFELRHAHPHRFVGRSCHGGGGGDGGCEDVPFVGLVAAGWVQSSVHNVCQVLLLSIIHPLTCCCSYELVLLTSKLN